MMMKIVYIIIAWSVLIFVGYNVLTAEATTTTEESKIKDVCKKMDGEWKDSECKFEKDGVEMGKKYSKEQYQVDFEHYISDKGLGEYYIQNQNIKKTCDKVDGKMNSKGECETDGSEDTPKADRFNDELRKLEESQEPVVIEDWKNEVEPADYEESFKTEDYSGEEQEQEEEQQEEESENEETSE